MTAAELIAALAKLPPDKTVYINDPDTGWAMKVVSAHEFVEGVVLDTVDYGEAGPAVVLFVEVPK